MSGAAAQRATRCGSCTLAYARLLRRHIGRDQPLAEHRPALAAVARLPHAAAGDRHEDAGRIARIRTTRYGCRHRRSRRRTTWRAPARPRATLTSCQCSPRSSERNRPAGSAPAQSRPGCIRAARFQRPDLEQRRRIGRVGRKRRRGQFRPGFAVVLGAMKLAAEMAVLEHGIERPVARVVQRGRHRERRESPCARSSSRHSCARTTAAPCASPPAYDRS